MLMKFTVLLLYPDYLANNYGEDTYLAHVEAVSPADAAEKAQNQAVKDTFEEDSAEDFLPLFIAYGFLDDVKS